MQSVDSLATELEDATPRAVLKKAFQSFDNIVLSFSGAEDVALIEMSHRLNPDLKVFTLDTGRLHPETYEFIEQVREHYGLKIELLCPNADALQAMVSEKGLFSFYRDGHQECCGIRKVEPLRRKLAGVDAWISGQRRDQSPSTRNDVPLVQRDDSFSTSEHSLVKFNPLANWTSKEVWDYIRMSEAPYNKLHEKGFVSIGCLPCTRPVLPGQHEREGRWWWEESTQKECGLHASNVIARD